MQPPAWKDFPIVDAHLDLAENVTLFGRDLTRELSPARLAGGPGAWKATVSLPEMVRGGIAVAFATVTPGFLAADVGEDFEPRSALYRTAEEAEAQALRQIRLYESWAVQGRVRLIRSRSDLEDHLSLWRGDRRPGLVLLMESADPIVSVGDLAGWWRRGLRIIGLTYGDTRYAAGVRGGSPSIRKGGLTPQGFVLMEAMAAQGFAWDISHLAEDGIWQGLGMGFPHPCASHALARALSPTDRHLSDEVIRALGERDGVIGLVLYNRFLEPRWRADRTIPVTLADQVLRQAEYIASVAGWEHVGIGSDLDGGFDRDASPREIDSIADLNRFGGLLPEGSRQAVLGGNWLRFLRAALPDAAL